MGQEEVECERPTNYNFSEGDLQRLMCPILDVTMLAKPFICDSLAQVQLLTQAHALMRKNLIYQKIDEALRKLATFQSSVYNNVPHNNPLTNSGEELVSSVERDSAVVGLRFLSIFYGCGPHSFSLATNLLDSLLGQVKVHPKSLPIIQTSCFYIATKNSHDPKAANIKPEDLLKVNQCDATLDVLHYMSNLIMEKVQFYSGGVATVTPLSFLQLFLELFSVQSELRINNEEMNYIVSMLEVLLCHFELTKYRSDVLALAFLNFLLQKSGGINNPNQLTTIVELQYYCRMSLEEYFECLSMVENCMTRYANQPTKRPCVKLSWTMSKRLLHKMKPSTRVTLTLEPIMEDEDDEGRGYEFNVSYSDPFDSETEGRAVEPDDVGDVEWNSDTISFFEMTNLENEDTFEHQMIDTCQQLAERCLILPSLKHSAPDRNNNRIVC